MVATTATITPTKTCMTSKAEADSNTEAGNIGGIMDIGDSFSQEMLGIEGIVFTQNRDCVLKSHPSPFDSCSLLLSQQN